MRITKRAISSGGLLNLFSKDGMAAEYVCSVKDEEEFDKHVRGMGELYDVARVKRDERPVVYRSFTPVASFGGLIKRGEGQRAVELLPDLCRALKAFHDRGYDHGCLAPHYIVVDDKGKVHLCGVGFINHASVFGTCTSDFADHMYAPPEAYVDPSARLSDEDKRRGDIFSLGCVIYYMLVGEHAFRADGLFMMIEKKKKMAAVEVPADVPARYKHLIEWCWKPSDERPSVDEVLEYLRE